MDDPHDLHVVPEFFLRNFAIDEARTKVTTLAKEGAVAVWMERSIKSIGYERDFYVHMQGNRPISVETDINRTVETPISRSDTWAKIVGGRSADLDQTDRPILYSLVRHLEGRTPHYLQTSAELAAMAGRSFFRDGVHPGRAGDVHDPARRPRSCEAHVQRDGPALVRRRL